MSPKGTSEPQRPAGGDGFELGLVLVLGAVMIVDGVV